MKPDPSSKAAEIIACARSLLATGGYNGFSYADISASVHITKASIHHHFPTKADLVQTVVGLYREEARAGLAALAAQVPDPLAQLHAYLGYWDACLRDGTASFCVCAMLGAEMPVLPAPVAAEVQGHFRDLSAWLASLLARGSAQGIFTVGASAEADAMALMAQVHGGMLSARVYGDPAIFASIVQRAVAQLTQQD